MPVQSAIIPVMGSVVPKLRTLSHKIVFQKIDDHGWGEQWPDDRRVSAALLSD